MGKGGDWGRGRPLGRRAAASSLRALRVFALHRGDPGPGWRLRLSRAAWVTANERSFRAALGLEPSVLGPPRLCRGSRRNAGKNRELGVQQLCSRSPHPPPSRQVLG